MPLLPIFPLGTVLMPGAVLPLQLFEARYLAMLRDLMGRPDNERRFGVVAIRLGHEVGENEATEVYDVGCVATIEQVAAVGDGRFSVVTRGCGRFRMGPLAVSSTPYLCAHTEAIDEGEHDEQLAARLDATVRRALAAYAALLPVDTGVTGDVDGLDPTELSYAVAARVRLTLDDEQRLLEAPDTVSRLQLASGLLRREIGLLQAISAIPIRAGMLPGRFSRN